MSSITDGLNELHDLAETAPKIIYDEMLYTGIEFRQGTANAVFTSGHEAALFDQNGIRNLKAQVQLLSERELEDQDIYTDIITHLDELSLLMTEATFSRMNVLNVKVNSKGERNTTFMDETGKKVVVSELEVYRTLARSRERIAEWKEGEGPPFSLELADQLFRILPPTGPAVVQSPLHREIIDVEISPSEGPKNLLSPSR